MKFLTAVWLIVLALPLRAAPAAGYFDSPEILDNGVVSLQVAPKTGRIIVYQRKGEVNWLSATDVEPTPGWHWNPWGGDRVWPSAQYMNRQIYQNHGFDPIIDGQPWAVVEKNATSLTMRSGVSPQLGLQITHRIELVAGSSTVLHRFMVERVSPSEFPVHIWAVTGVKAGDYMLMESDPRVEHDDWKPFKWWREMSTDIPAVHLLPKTRILHVPWTAQPLKVGSFGRWIALVAGSSAFVQTVSYEFGAPYLENSNLQAFINNDPSVAKYEIETLSPSWFLRQGEKRSWQIRWQLVDFPHDEPLEKRAATLVEKTAVSP